ncbi:MAG: hypothetical protein RLZZ243_276 [Bacteroidota bacterium]|jgi:uncharacterized protein (DUF2141 family)
MKTLLSTCISIFISFHFLAQASTYNLTVKVSGIEVKKGMVEYGLFRDAEKFTKIGGTYRMIRVKVDASEETVTFHNLPKGKYAVCIYLDENNNDQCDKNFFGIPTERFAFSNNLRPLLSAPSFEACSIYLNENKSIIIRADY